MWAGEASKLLGGIKERIAVNKWHMLLRKEKDTSKKRS